MFKVKNLNKAVNNKPILRNVNFEVEHGQVAIFLGGSGVGKSTLLRVLNHLEGYETGEFSLDEVPLDLTQVNKNHTVGMVFQHFNLFEHLSVEENITLALMKVKGISKQEAEEIASNLLIRYGLEDKKKSGIHKLSGGQKQRLAIARTLALDPKIICLDEPTSALDPLLTTQVAKSISELAADHRIVLVATHDMQLVKHLDAKIFLMKEGSIVESCLKKDYEEDPTAFPYLQCFLQNGL